MALYKQSTAYTRTFFLVQSADHLSALTGATPTVNLSKAGAAFGAAAGAVAEIGSGWYKVSLTTADTGTLGDLAFHVTATSADDTDFVDQIVAVDLQDAVAFGLSRLDAAVSSRMATFTLPTNFSSFVIDVNGRVDLSKWIGVAPAAVTTNGYVQTALQRWKTDDAAGTPNALITNRVDSNAQVVGDKTGYSLASLDSPVLHSGTAQAGAAGTITLAAGASATDSLYNGEVIAIYGGTGAGQSRVITGYVGATKVATVDRNWTTAPDATSTYKVIQSSAPKLDASLQVTAASVQGNVTGSVASVTGAVGSVTAGVTVTTNNDKTAYALSTAGVQAVWDEATSSLTTVGSIGKRLADDIDATISSRSTYAGGAVASVTGAVGSVAAGGITAASFGVGAVDSTALASSAVQKIHQYTTEGALTFEQIVRIVLAGIAGKSNSHELGTPKYRNVADSADRISATTDVNGNRTAVTLTGT